MPWRSIARPNQLPPPEEWSTWLILAGRGFGKTRTGAEWFREKAKQVPILRIIAPTFADARDTCIEGESGLRSICPPGELVKWNRSLGEGEFSNGARFKLFSGNEPDRLRGPQSYADWCDELGAWDYAEETWDMAQMGLRLGTNPQACVTTTPRPIKIIRDLIAATTTHLTRGSTYDNRANLAASFFEKIIKKYEGTRLGRQELNAELLEDVPGALWNRVLLEEARVTQSPDMQRVVVAIDPEAKSGEESAETGIVAAGVGLCTCKGKERPERHAFVLEDASVRATPHGWALQAVALYNKYRGDRLIAEDNNGGEMVEYTISTMPGAPPVKRIHASRSKQARAEPVAALYEQGRVHHVGAGFELLEDQLCNWIPGVGASPDRLDALVWALTELMLVSGEVEYMENPFYN